MELQVISPGLQKACAVTSAPVLLGGHQVDRQPQSTCNATPEGLRKFAVYKASF